MAGTTGSCVASVRSFDPDEGWGVLDSAQTPGGCWCHFSSLDLPGYRVLTPGQTVTLEWERADQDGCHFRAVRVVP